MVQLVNLILHNTGKLQIYLVCDGLESAETEYVHYVLRTLRATKRTQIHFINAAAEYKARIQSDINVTPNFTRFTLYRLLLPSLLPASVTKILYLDADTLVQGSLHTLYKRSLGKNLLGAVRDPGAFGRKQQLGFDEREDYFNAGVLLLNLREIRQQNLEIQWLQMVNSTSYVWPDQDILNITCRGKVSWLSPVFNVFGDAQAKKKPRIIHYIVQKPWRNHSVSRYDAWSRARRQFDKQMFKIPKILHWIIIEGEKSPDHRLDRRLANAGLLDDFEIHIHCMTSDRLACQPQWQRLFEKCEFEVLRHEVARHFINQIGGVFVGDSIRLRQPVDALLRHKAFSFAGDGHNFPKCFGSIPHHKWKQQPDEYTVAGVEAALYWDKMASNSWAAGISIKPTGIIRILKELGRWWRGIFGKLR